MANPSRKDEDDAKVPTSVALGNRLLSIVEDIIYVSIAVLLASAALVVTFRSGQELISNAGRSGPDPMLNVLDSLLLVFIFVELLYAVRMTLRERQIVAEPFLIAGILASIKEIIVLSVKAPSDYLSRGPEFARAMVEIGLLGGLILVLAAAAVVLRKKEKEPEENTGTKSQRARSDAA